MRITVTEFGRGPTVDLQVCGHYSVGTVASLAAERFGLPVGRYLLVVTAGPEERLACNSDEQLDAHFKDGDTAELLDVGEGV